MPPRVTVGLVVAYVATSLIRVATAQTSHTVNVGAQGSFYNPPTTSAAINDTVTFVFDAPGHSVIQAAWENPCFPIPGGFSSGIVKTNSSAGAPVWTLKITNDTFGIWFYCGSTIPLSHCASGMVGAINTPSIDLYDQYLAAAKLVTGVAPPVTVALSGQSAFATAAPQPPTSNNTQSASVSSTTFTSSSSSTASPPSLTPSATATNAPVPSSSNKGGIIGGSVAGGVVFLAILSALLCFVIRRNARRSRRGSKDFFRYRAQTPTLGGPSIDSFNPTRMAASSGDRARQALLSPTAQSTPLSPPSTLTPSVSAHPYSNAVSSTGHSSPGHAASPPRPKPVEPGSQPRPLPPPSTTGPTPPAPPPPPLADHKPPLPVVSATTEDGTNIHVLAREVAAVLSQGHLGVRGGLSRESSSRNSPNRVESPAPPGYRATIL